MLEDPFEYDEHQDEDLGVARGILSVTLIMSAIGIAVAVVLAVLA